MFINSKIFGCFFIYGKKIMNNQKFIEAFKLMSTSRILDKKMMNLLKQGKAFFHMGAAGHEAVQAATSMLLNVGKDWLYPYYRDQVLCLGLDMPIRDLFLGFLAKKMILALEDVNYLTIMGISLQILFQAPLQWEHNSYKQLAQLLRIRKLEKNLSTSRWCVEVKDPQAKVNFMRL
jgi:hypothetical protein